MGRRTLDLSEGNEIQAIKESVRCDSLLASAFQEVVVLELFGWWLRDLPEVIRGVSMGSEVCVGGFGQDALG